MKKILFVLTLVMLTEVVFAQSNNIYESFYPDNSPKASDEVTAMGDRYNMSMNYYTGSIDLNVPLVSLDANSYSLPLTLDYKPGLKISDVAGSFGAGWNLSGVGAIYREIRDVSDFKLKQSIGSNLSMPLNEYWRNIVNSLSNEGSSYGVGWCTTNCELGVCNRDDHNVQKLVMEKFLDTEPDIFTLVLPGFTTRFVFTDKDEINCESDDNIQFLTIPEHDNDQWVIRMSNGVKYYFGYTDSDLATAYSSNAIVTPQFTPHSLFGNANATAYQATEWKLVKIETANGDIIEFTYDKTSIDLNDLYTPASLEIIYASRILNREYLQVSLGQNFIDPNPYAYPNTTTDFFNIQKIEFTNTIYTRTIKFDYISRNDVNNLKCVSRLRYQTFLNSHPESIDIIRQFDFDYHFTSNGSWLTEIHDNAALEVVGLSHTQPGYSFEYYNYDEFPAKSSLARDFWGYFNNQNNSRLIPAHNLAGGASNFLIDDPEVVMGNRLPSAMHAIHGNLKKVVTPLGLNIDIEYELNTFKMGSLDVSGAGIRVSKTKKKDPNTDITEELDYLYLVDPLDMNSGSSGIIMKRPKFEFNCGEVKYWQNTNDIPNYLIMRSYAHMATASDIYGLSTSAGGAFVGYTRVGVRSSLNGLEVFKYYNKADADEPNVSWSGVSGYENTDIKPYHIMPFLTYRAMNGKLLERTVYSENEGLYAPQFKEIFSYTTPQVISFHGAKVFGSYLGLVIPAYMQSTWTWQEDEGECTDMGLAYYSDNLSFAYPKGKKTIYFDEAGLSFTNEEEYTYSTTNGKLINVLTKTLSLTATRQQTIYMDANHLYNDTPTIDLIAANIILPSETRGYIGDELVSHQLFAYDGAGNQTATYSKNFGSGAPCSDSYIPVGFEKMNQNLFDINNHLIESKNMGDVTTSHVYSLNSYKTASCRHAEHTEILAVDFEQGETHGLSIESSNSGFIYGEAKTGTQCANVRHATVGQPVNQNIIGYMPILKSTRCYILSAWIKTGPSFTNGSGSLILGTYLESDPNQFAPTNPYSKTVFEIQQTQGAWILCQAIVDLDKALEDLPNPEAYGLKFYFENTDQNWDGDIYVDDLRFQPIDASMETIVLDLKGQVLAQYDASNNLTTYLHDAFGRITSIKDKDDHIIKEIKYNFQND